MLRRGGDLLPGAGIDGLVLDHADEFAQFLFAELGDGEIIHARLGPAKGVVAVLVVELAVKRIGVGGPDEEVDVVLAPLVDDGRDVCGGRARRAGHR